MVPDRWHPQNERRAPAIFASSSRVSIERFADICIPLRVVRFLTRLKTLYFPSFPIPRPPQWLKGKFPFLPLEIASFRTAQNSFFAIYRRGDPSSGRPGYPESGVSTGTVPGLTVFYRVFPIRLPVELISFPVSASCTETIFSYGACMRLIIFSDVDPSTVNLPCVVVTVFLVVISYLQCLVAHILIRPIS